MSLVKPWPWEGKLMLLYFNIFSLRSSQLIVSTVFQEKLTFRNFNFWYRGWRKWNIKHLRSIFFRIFSVLGCATLILWLSKEGSFCCYRNWINFQANVISQFSRILAFFAKYSPPKIDKFRTQSNIKSNEVFLFFQK